MGVLKEAVFLQLGHLVPYGGGGYVAHVFLADLVGTDGFSTLKVVVDDGAEYFLFSCIQCLHIGTPVKRVLILPPYIYYVKYSADNIFYLCFSMLRVIILL